jgi:hypothetical protein
MRVLIVGRRYVGLPLGAELVRQGQEVFGLRRTALAAAELSAAGITPLWGDVAKPEDPAPLPAGYHWVVHCLCPTGSIGPRRRDRQAGAQPQTQDRTGVQAQLPDLPGRLPGGNPAAGRGGSLAGIFQDSAPPLINTVALARCTAGEQPSSRFNGF